MRWGRRTGRGRLGRSVCHRRAHPRCAVTDEVRGHLPPGTVREKEAVVNALIPALRVAIALQPPVASESRWGMTQRCAAALAARILLHRLGPRALVKAWPGSPGPDGAAAAAAAAAAALDSEVSLAELQGRRMRSLRSRWSDAPRTLACYLVFTLALEPMHSFLCQLYLWEAHVYPDLREHARRLDGRLDHLSTDAVDGANGGAGAGSSGRRPAGGGGAPEMTFVARLASGEVVSNIIADAASMLGPAERCEPHVLAVREIAAAGLGWHEATRCLRTALLPGLAQLWFRVLWTYTRVWPWKLLQLLPGPSQPPAAARNEVVAEFMRACPQCLDRGLSSKLRSSCGHAAGPMAADQFVAEGSEARVLLEQLRADMEVSIIDVEPLPQPEPVVSGVRGLGSDRVRKIRCGAEWVKVAHMFTVFLWRGDWRRRVR